MNEAHFRSLSPSALDAIFYYKFKALTSVQQSQVRRALVSSSAHALLTTAYYPVFDTSLNDINLSSASRSASTSLLLILVTHVFVIATYI